MVIDKGEKVHIVMRRRFEEDVRRHFAGVVTAVDGTRVRVEGYAFIFDSGQNQFVRSSQTRVSIFELAESGYVVNVIPQDVALDGLKYADTGKGNRLTDDGAFQLDVNEFGPYR